jgi:polygalacturonase
MSYALSIVVFSIYYIVVLESRLSTTSVFDVTSFGAVGDGTTDDTLSIQRTFSIAAANATLEHPSVVLFPSNGTFFTGPMNLSSNIIMQVDGLIKAKSGNNSKTGITGWPQIPPLVTYGDSRDGPYLQYQAIIYAVNQTNIKIIGEGTIDGQGDWWWANSRNRSAIVSGRPNLVQLVGCSDIEMRGVTFRDSPFWCVHPVMCENVHIHNITIRSRMYAHNSDGIDPDSSKHVMVENNDVSCGDDHIAIKAGVCGASSPNSCADRRFQDGTFETRNVTIRNNIFRIGMGISVGSESSGGIHDVKIYDNIIGLCDAGHCLDTCCGWGPALHLKTALTRGNSITGISFVNNTIYNNTGFIDVETNYQSGDTPPVGYPATKVSNITFSGNRALGTATGASFVCSVRDFCENIIVTDNFVKNSADPWHCSFIDTYSTSGNFPSGLQECMYKSMNRTTSKEHP